MDWFKDSDPVVVAAVVAAIVSLVTVFLTYVVNKKLERAKLRLQHEQAATDRLAKLIGRYVGQLGEAAETFNYRMWNLYNEPEHEEDLAQDGDFSRPHYYLDSMVYRFLGVVLVVRSFEAEAVFIDPRYARKGDLDFVKVLKALRWTLTDDALFEGLDSERRAARDHFFVDQLRQICDSAVDRQGRLLPRENVRLAAKDEAPVAHVYAFFDGLNREEDRYRWDRLVVFHLFVMLSLNFFGYDMQQTDEEKLEEATRHVRHPEVIRNTLTWLPKLGLKNQREVQKFRRALESSLKPVGSP